MSLRADQLAALDRLLDRMMALPAPERAAWVDALQGDDAALAPALRDLLARPGMLDAEDGPDAWSLPLRAAIAGATGAVCGLSAGQAVGPYRLRQVLGEGGMGVVWLAERADGTLRRQVALKLPRPGLKQWRLDERFQRERDILGSLEHPHIARLYEAGVTPEGQPFLAMEFVQGRPITEHAEAAGLDVRARVRLFLQVLAAVQHAHQHLVVHRDLKPSNILVDAQGSARLLDFGIAQLQDEAVPQAALTEFGQTVLTPQYASPEQVAHAPVSTASDLYSLGVVLCELLSGRRPYAPARDTRAALEEAILQGDLLRPSQLAPPARAGALRGDLDNVVRKALQRDPSQRYASADAFAQDLQRHLAGVPVLAHPDSLAYRAGKFASRNRLAVAASAAVALALLAGSGLALWQASVARDQAARAVREAARASAVQQFLVGLFDAADPARAQGRDTTVHDLMAKAERDLPQLGGEPESAHAVRGAMVRIYSALGDEQRALPLAQAQLEQSRRLYGGNSAEYGLSLQALAGVEGSMRHSEAALQHMLQAEQVLQHHATTHAEALLALPEEIAAVLLNLQRPQQAAGRLEQALPALRAHYGPAAWPVISARAQLASTWAQLGRQDEALAEVRALQPLLQGVAGDHALDAAMLAARLGYVLLQARQWPEARRWLTHARAEMDRLEGTASANTMSVTRGLAVVLREQGDYRATAALADDNARRSRASLGPDSGTTALNESFRTFPMLMLGRVDEALQIARAAVHTEAAHPGLSPGEQQVLQRNLGLALLFAGRGDEALALLHQLDAQERSEHAPPDARLRTQSYLASALRMSGAAAAAVQQMNEVVARLHATAGPANRNAEGRALVMLALALAEAGQAQVAAVRWTEGQTLLRGELPAQHVALRGAELVHAAVLRAQGQPAAAQVLERDTRDQLQREAGVVLPPSLPLLP